MYSGPIVDCDVHHAVRSQQDLFPYLSEGWREYVLGPGRAGPIALVGQWLYQNPHGFDREDAFPETGEKPGSHIPTVQKQLLDRFRIERAILTFDELLGVSAQGNPYFAAEIARAANDWTIENWLSQDPRYYGSILVANQLPELAVQEIQRLGDHPRMAQVLMANNGLGKPYGHPLFHPIYEAAMERQLPLAIHTGGGGGLGPAPTGGGHPSFYLEYHTLIVQSMQSTLVSFITQGVFEKFAELKLILVEGGVAWAPPLMWKLDASYKHLRREVPWVKQLPSDYVRSNVRFTTQPLEISSHPEQLIGALETIGGEDILLFATDYPHWDADDPMYISERLPESWLPKVFYRNAMKLYGWADDRELAAS